MPATYQIGDLFRTWGKSYIGDYHPHVQHIRILRAIQLCRTPALGGVMVECQECGHQHFIYRSCGNRNCPICPAVKKELWMLNREKELLPVPYFHVVFTLPHELNVLCLNHPRLLYNCMRAVNHVLPRVDSPLKFV